MSDKPANIDIEPASKPNNLENVSDTAQPFMEDSVLLKSNDEFYNQKSSELIKFFHSTIKQYLLDPEKQFILLVNDNINMNKFKSIWANDTNLENKLFFIHDNESSVVVEDKDMPKLIIPYDAKATDYKTETNGIQRFPTTVLEFNKNKYWYSDTELEQLPDKKRVLSIFFKKPTKIKYIGIDFVNPATLQQEFHVIYKSDQKTKLGEPIYYLAFENYKNSKEEGIQLIEFENQIITDEIVLDYVSEIGAINYIVAIEDQLNPNVLEMFNTNTNNNEDQDQQ